ncbi:MAG TPA: hypothetical protein VER58_09185 [Thermoanaerobaculia bacterium]|nr:hypothetical protein [Thermoanaerobaculia bacterium]
MTTTKRTILALALAIAPAAAFATHVPGSSEKVEYDGPLTPGTGVKGSIGWKDPVDGYDWYCMDVTKGRKVTLGAKRTAGDIKLNIGVLKGLVAKDGDPRGSLTVVGETGNSSDPDVVFNFTPDFDGAATVWVSTWLGENGGNYTLTMTGGNARAACGAVTGPPAPPPSSIQVGVPDNPVLVNSGDTTTVPVQVATSSFAGDISLSVEGLPDDATAKFDKSFFPSPGNGTTTLTITPGPRTLPGTYFITVIATSGDTSGATTFQFVIDCSPPMILGIDQPKSSTINRGSTANLQVKSAGTGPFTYQWYAGIPGSTNFPISGANKQTLTTSAINDTSLFWVRVSNACGATDSQAATITTR